MVKYIVLLLLTPVYGAFGQSLLAYQEMAASENAALNAHYKSFEIALKQAAQAGFLPEPTVSLGYFFSPVETRVGPQRWRLGLSQQFPWFGTLEQQRQVGALKAKVKYQAFLAQQRQLAVQVAKAYYPLYEPHVLIDLEKENLALLSTYKKIVEAQLESGKGKLSAMVRVELAEERSKASIDVLEREKQSLKAYFNQLINRDIDSDIALEDSLTFILPPQRLSPDSLFEQQPLLEGFELQQEMSSAQASLAEKKGKPSFGIGLNYIVTGPRSDASPLGQGKDAFLPQVSVKIPIARKKYQAGVEEATLQQEQFRLQEEDFRQRVLSEYERAWYALNKQQELIELYKSQISKSQQLLDLLFTEYGNSKTSFGEVIQVQQDIVEYRKKYLKALVKYRQAWAGLVYQFH